VPQARISDATFYTWRTKYGGMEVGHSQVGSNRKLKKQKKLLAQPMLDVATLREALGRTSDAQFPEDGGQIDQKDYSQRRACGLIGFAPKTCRYVTARGNGSEFRERLPWLAAERRRSGYRRLHILSLPQ